MAIISAFIVAGVWAMVNREGWQGSFTPFMTSGWTGMFAAMGLTFMAAGLGSSKAVQRGWDALFERREDHE